MVATANQPDEKNLNPTEVVETKIIKEGNVRFETNDLDTTYKKIIAETKKNKATIQNDV